jgi:hypothetical protein
VTLRARWVTLRARWVTLRARWVTLRARWVTFTVYYMVDSVYMPEDESNSLVLYAIGLGGQRQKWANPGGQLFDWLGGEYANCYTQFYCDWLKSADGDPVRPDHTHSHHPSRRFTRTQRTLLASSSLPKPVTR